MSFLEGVNKYQDSNTGCQLSAEDWTSLYPIHRFDVSKHNDRLKNSSADIKIRFNLGSNFKTRRLFRNSFSRSCRKLAACAVMW